VLPYSGGKANYCTVSFVLWDIFGRFSDKADLENREYGNTDPSR
jgi:hypothetical protein